MKKLAIALAAILVIVGVAAIYLWRELGAQRHQNAETMTRAVALELHLAESSGALPGAAAAQSAGVSQMPGTSGPASSAAALEQSASGGADSLMAQIGQLRNTPEGMEFQRVMMRQMLEQKYPDLAKAMNLSPEKAEKLLDLLAKQQADLGSDLLGLQAGGKQDRAAREEAERNLEKKQQAFQGEVSALLGSSYTKWQEYERTAADRQREGYARQAKEELRTAISSGATPLTDAQFEYLNTALAAEQKRIDQESRDDSLQQHLQRMPEVNRRLVNVAAAHLNSQQLERYKHHLEQEEEMLRMMEATDSSR